MFLFQFRIAILLSHHSELIVSEPSVVISTLPSGVPSSAPTIVRATAVDSSRISVSWEPGPFPNGPVLSYVLQINELPEGYSALKVSQRGPYHACAQFPISFNNSTRLSASSFVSSFILHRRRAGQKVYKAYILKQFIMCLMLIKQHHFMTCKLFLYIIPKKNWEFIIQ
jgi:hypothetical protein